MLNFIFYVEDCNDDGKFGNEFSVGILSSSKYYRKYHRYLTLSLLYPLERIFFLIVNSLINFSASGCPIANRNKMRVLENGGTIEQHKAAVAVATAMKFDGVNCPTHGCDGKTVR